MQQSTICPSGSRTLRSQTWLRKIDARNCIDIFNDQPLDAISCVDFAKPCLASQNSWARRANCWLLHYCLKPFNLPFRLRSFAKPDIASQNMRWFIQLYQNNRCNLLRWYHVWLCIVDSFWDIANLKLKLFWNLALNNFKTTFSYHQDIPFFIFKIFGHYSA